MKNGFFGEQGSFALGYRVHLPEKYSLGEEDYDNLNEFWAKALRDLPTGTIFLKQDIFKESEYSTSDFPNRNFLEKVTKEYFEGTEFLSHTTNIFFILPNQSISLTRLKNPIRPPKKKEFLDFDEKIKEFSVSVQQAIDFLQNSKVSGNRGVVIEPLEQSYIEQYYDYINSGLNENYTVDIKNEWEHLRIGNQYASILMFPNEEKFPDKMKTCRIDGEMSNDKAKFFKNYGDNFSFDLPFTHIYNQIAVIDDNKYHYNQAMKYHNDLNKFRKFDKKNEWFAQETEQMLKEMAKHSDSERIVRGHNNIVVFAHSESELENRLNRVSERFKDIDIKPERVFGDNLMAIFEYSYPLNAHLFIDEHYYVANLQMFSSFLTLTGKYNDNQTGLRLNSRLKGMIPTVVDIWDDDRKYMNARNFFIVASTGGGKSFTANHIISHYYSDGARLSLI